MRAAEWRSPAEGAPSRSQVGCKRTAALFLQSPPGRPGGRTLQKGNDMTIEFATNWAAGDAAAAVLRSVDAEIQLPGDP